MAMFFYEDDAHIKCPDCGSTLLYSRALGTYEPHTKDKTVLVFKPVVKELVCSQCNTVVKTLDPLETTRGDYGNT